MEARVNGIVRPENVDDVKELFTAMSGLATPCPIEIHEIVIKDGTKSDIVVHRYRANERKGVYVEGTRWVASQFSKPPWGDKVLDSLCATVRLSKNVPIPGEGKGRDVSLKVWRDLGYTVRYHLVKDGVASDIISPRGARVQTILYMLYEGKETDDGGVSKGECCDGGGVHVVEAWVDIHPDGGHEKALEELSWLIKLLQSYNVNLVPIIDRKKWMKDRNK